MKRTNMEVCCGKTNTCDVYRTVWEADGHYFVKWNGKIINVDDIANRNFIYKH